MRTKQAPLVPLLSLLAASLLFVGGGCNSKAPDAPLAHLSTTSGSGSTGSAKPSANGGPSSAGTPGLFAEVTEAAGIRYRWEIPGKRPLNILQTIGNGGAFLDYDNDGNLDILLVGPKLALYKGDGHGHFTDVTTAAGLDRLSGHFLGCAVGDYDNDGFEDVYITAYRGGLLLHNETWKSSDPPLFFRDVTRQAGIKPQRWGTSAAFADVDGDGRLDLYICNYIEFGPNTEPQLCEQNKHMSSCGPRFYQPEKGVLYQNLGSGTFRDVTQAWGAQGNNVSGKGLGVSVADFDGSGRQSIAIANDEVAGDLLQNLGRKFKNVGAASGTAYDSQGNVHGGMGLDWGDYDNDGRLDLTVATFQHEAKCMYHNEGGGFFVENSAALGLADKTMPLVAFGIKFLDYDNDGWLDLVIANGHVQDNINLIDKSATYKQKAQLFHNSKGTLFEDVSAQGGSGFQKEIAGRGLAIGDYDNDGKVDVLLIDSEDAPILLHNETPNAGHWLSLKLEGVKSNRDGLGALVTVEAGGQKQVRRCGTDGSYMSASDRRVHIGLGEATSAKITVRWPSGKTNTYKAVPADKIVTLQEGSSAVR